MEKTEVTLSFDSEKMSALKIYLEQGGSTVQKKMDEALRLLYEQTVPESVREYLDIRAAPARPKRPTRPSRPKADMSKQAPVPTD